MTFSTADVFALIAILLTVSGSVYGYGRLNRSVETLEKSTDLKAEKEDLDNLIKSSDEQHKNLWKVVGDLRDKYETHVEEANEYRFQTQKEMSTLREIMGSKDGKLDALVIQIGEIKESLREIRSYIERKERNV